MSLRRQVPENPGRGDNRGGFDRFQGILEQLKKLTTDVDALAALQASGNGKLRCEEFLASGTFQWPDGVTGAWVEIQAPGGGGGGRDSTAAGRPGGGGAGEWLRRYIRRPSSGQTAITIGAAGAAGTSAAGATNTDGSTGGNTSITNEDVTITARAGSGGKKSVGAAHGAGGDAGGAYAPAGGVAGAAGVDAVVSIDTTSGGSGSGGNAPANGRGGRCANNLGGLKISTAGGGGASYSAPGSDGASGVASATAAGSGAGGGGGESAALPAAAGGPSYVRFFYVV